MAESRRFADGTLNLDPAPYCRCGHDMYSHYMCGTVEEMRCLRCTCKPFAPLAGGRSITRAEAQRMLRLLGISETP